MSKKKNKLLKEALLLSSIILTSCGNENTINAEIHAPVFEKVIEAPTFDNNSIKEEPEEIVIEPVIPENEHVDLVMIGDVLVHKPVYTSGIKEDGTYNYDHFFTNKQED